MTYRIARVDPFWWKTPALPAIAAAAGAAALFAAQSGRAPLAVIAAVACGIAVFLDRKSVV